MIFYINGSTPTKVQACQMDTDSFYISISKDCLEDSLKDDPTLDDDGWVAFVEQFHVERDKYLVTKQSNDVRMPGLFKLEWEGDRNDLFVK